MRRNLTEIKNHGIHLDGAYLDVFTCNEGDECDNPRHRMSRKECYENRKKCFDFLISRNILPSSEEASDWAMKSLVFCHYAPYSFMLQTPGTEQIGVSRRSLTWFIRLCDRALDDGEAERYGRYSSTPS